MDFALDERKKFKYDNMGDITKIAFIISNGDMKVVESFTLLEEDADKFRESYPNWNEDFKHIGEVGENFKLLAFAYGLTWYVDNYKYGVYFREKDDTENLILQLENTSKCLKYDIDFNGFEYSEDEVEEKAVMLKRLSKYVGHRNYGLLHLESSKDCYHIFIVRICDIDEILEIGKNVGFEFRVL